MPVVMEQKPNGRGSGLGRDRIHADFTPRLATFKLHHAGHRREERVISAEVHIESGEEFGAALTDNDASGLHGFPAIGLDAQILGVTIPPVT